MSCFPLLLDTISTKKITSHAIKILQPSIHSFNIILNLYQNTLSNFEKGRPFFKFLGKYSRPFVLITYMFLINILQLMNMKQRFKGGSLPNVNNMSQNPMTMVCLSIIINSFFF